MAQGDHSLVGYQATGQHQAGEGNPVESGNSCGHHDVFAISGRDQKSARPEGFRHVPNATGANRYLLDPPGVHLPLIEDR